MKNGKILKKDPIISTILDLLLVSCPSHLESRSRTGWPILPPRFSCYREVRVDLRQMPDKAVPAVQSVFWALRHMCTDKSRSWRLTGSHFGGLMSCPSRSMDKDRRS